MVSLFKSVKISDIEARLESLQQITNLLLEGIRLHAICAAKPLYQDFQKDMEEHVLRAGKASHDHKAHLLAAGAILQTMHTYARESEASIAAGRKELQAIVVMLTRSLTRILDGNERSISSLQSFERHLDGVSHVDDIRTVKGELENCLKFVQAEARRQSDEKAQLNEVVRSVSQNPAVVTSFADQGEDAVTGLPSLAAARNAIAEAFNTRKDIYIIPLRVESLQTINSRYGREAGDRFLVEASQLIAQRLGSADTLYRWGGPCLLAVLQGRPTLEAVRAEVDRLAHRAREHSVALSGRSVIFKVGISSLCIRALQWPDLETLIGQIDAFAYKEQNRK